MRKNSFSESAIGSGGGDGRDGKAAQTVFRAGAQAAAAEAADARGAGAAGGFSAGGSKFPAAGLLSGGGEERRHGDARAQRRADGGAGGRRGLRRSDERADG